jgi:Histidine kinase-, DNA gyrase B-, and HSP90-like ATPase
VHTIALFTQMALPGIQQWAEGFKEHQVTINLLTFVIVGITASMMLMAHRRIMSENWIKYFAWMFFLLSAQYFYLLSVWLLTSHPTPADQRPTPYLNLTGFIILELLSIATNLCGIAAARDIQNKKPLFPSLSNRLRKAGPRDAGGPEPLIPRWCWLLAFGALITTVAGYAPQVESVSSAFNLQYKEYPAFYELLGRSLESLFSAISLFWIGYVIFANLSNRRHPVNVSAAFLIAVVYAFIQLAFGLSPLLSERFITAETFNEKLLLADSFLMGISLIPKIILCIFAYRLVVRFFGTLSELRKLQDSGFDRRQDYLSSDGVMWLISEKLKGKTPKRASGDGKMFPGTGFVNLVIKLPGETNKRVACIFWPNYAREKRAIPFDWQAGLMKFSSFYVNEGDEENIDEDARKNRPIVLELKEALPFAGLVLTKERRKEIVWPEEHFESQPDVAPYRGSMKAMVSMVIQTHGGAIGCLQIARSKSPFSQMAIRQIREIANLLSPAVQAYRELAGLDQMSIRFTQKQAETAPHSPEAAAKAIAKIVHDIFAPTVTRLHMDFGFTEAKTIPEVEENQERVLGKIEKEIKGKKWEEYPDTIMQDMVTYRLLKKQLTARVTETISHNPQTPGKDRFIMGNLIFAVRDDKDRYSQATLGTTYLHRKTASTLTADAYLDFTRDYYNDLLKMLGRELSGKQLNIDAWFEPIQRILTKKAGLLWVVVRQRGRAVRLGDKEGLCVLQGLKRSTRQRPEATRRFKPPDPPEIRTHYYLKDPKSKTNHVLKLRLSSADGFIWLGVERPDFESELDFSSPWKTFLINFVQIADASLSRITFPEKFQSHLEAAQLQGIIASIATSATVIHQVRNMIAVQSHTTSALLEAIEFGELQTDDEGLKGMIREMNEHTVKLREVFESFPHLTGEGDYRPCRLFEAAQRAFKLYEISLTQGDIKTQVSIDESILIDVPSNVAALALATLVGNSKDAVKGRGGMIRIEAERDGDFVLCRIIDNGGGITPEIRKKIFEPKDRTKKYGTGMGLYLTSHSLSENGSSIELTKSDETGSTFTIRFPAAKEANI